MEGGAWRKIQKAESHFYCSVTVLQFYSMEKVRERLWQLNCGLAKHTTLTLLNMATFREMLWLSVKYESQCLPSRASSPCWHFSAFNQDDDVSQTLTDCSEWPKHNHDHINDAYVAMHTCRNEACFQQICSRWIYLNSGCIMVPTKLIHWVKLVAYPWHMNFFSPFFGLHLAFKV